MATIKEIAEIVGVSSAAVSRVLNYDEGISVSDETREAIFATAEKIGYKKKVIYPKIENVALLCFTDNEDELEDVFYCGVREELMRQAAKMNIQLSVFDRKGGMDEIPRDLNAFIAVGWLNRKEINQLYGLCKKGVFIGTSPDEKLFDAVKPNMDSFVTQMVDYFVEKGHKSIGFIGGSDRNIDTGKPSMDIREWSFRQSASYYQRLNEDYILISEKFTVDDGYRMGKELLTKNPLPSALCVASDTLAVGVLQALNEGGIQVPEQMAVFSINDVNIAKYLSPPLTTIHIDIACICETALDLLRNRVLYGGKVTKLVFVNGIPVFRKSC
ncbi:MAG: LacI family DNA-binding transcriptional regulator [Bacillus sp. (in: Bacteria)]|nr:LacI family DNA-binding transcriptional regulator [Bacillus sp. (in: firmicutes)]MCM1427661.1 LacI family DNA-binding transcriptional regulator [Eubacterium sp.]